MLMKKKLTIFLFQKILNKSILIILFSFNLFSFSFYNIDLFSDFISIHRNIFKLNTLNIFSALCPVYLISLGVDQDLNYIFYDKKNSKNIRQFTDFKYNYSNILDPSDILLTSSLILNFSSIFFKDYRSVGCNSVLGLISMNLVKKSIKFIKWPNSLRPYNQNFKRDYGGFPSGHLMTITYLSIISIEQFGFLKSLPYIISFSYISVDYIVKNRHYLSQLVAGVILGSVYGFSVNSSIKNSLDFNSDFNLNNNLKLSYSF